MSRFFRPGAIDDSVLSDGDRSFGRLNTRLEPHFLEPGEVVVSDNGRMDRGVWQPRAGIECVTSALQASVAQMRVPFIVLADVDVIATDYSWGVGRVTLKIDPARMPSGWGWCVVSGHDPIPLEGGGTYDINGAHQFTTTNPDLMVLFVSGVQFADNPEAPMGGVISAKLEDDNSRAILGSCVYSDPATTSDDVIVIAANGRAASIDLTSGQPTYVEYPAGEMLEAEVDMIQAFDRVYIFREGQQAWEWFGPNGRPIVSAARTAGEMTVEVYQHGHTAGDAVVISGLSFTGDDPNGEYVITSVSNTGFVVVSAGTDEVFGAGTGVSVSGFTLVPGGEYTQPQVFRGDGADVVVMDGVCTVTVAGNVTVREGDEVQVYGSDDPAFAPYIGQRFEVFQADASSIAFYIPVEDLTSADTYVSVGRQVSVGLGYQHMPAPGWAVYHQRRLICPYAYNQKGVNDAPEYVKRNVADEIVFSDILDPNTYDAIESQFRVTAGIADHLVGLQPFYEDAILVFNRNSIHAIYNISGALDDSLVREMTREVGCAARRSIAMHGAEIFFLSDSGVYGVAFLDEYNLRGVDVPLSEAIQPTMDRINPRLMHKAVGVYHDNRYRLAVPLDSTVGADDATGNNAILVYNFLNKGWESIDVVSDERWEVTNLLRGRSDNPNDVYAINNLGGVHRLDALDERVDVLALSSGDGTTDVTVDSKFQPRQYDFRVQDRKRFLRCQLLVEGGGQLCDAALSFSSEDPDGVEDLGSISDSIPGGVQPGESASVRVRTAGLRGHGGTVTVTPTNGRPRIKSTSVDAAVAGRSTTSTD